VVTGGQEAGKEGSRRLFQTRTASMQRTDFIDLMAFTIPVFPNTQLSYTFVLNFQKVICFSISCFHANVLVFSRRAKLALISFPQQGH